MEKKLSLNTKFNMANVGSNVVPINPKALISPKTAPAYCWVMETMDRLNYVVDAGGRMIHGDYDSTDLWNALVLMNAQLGKSEQHNQAPLKSAMDLALKALQATSLEDLKCRISTTSFQKHVPTVLDDLESLFELGMVRGDNGYEGFTPREAVSILCKTVWQVKRKMHGIQVTDHTMLVIVGGQGVGKSNLVKEFVKPVQEVVSSTDMSEVCDVRNIQLFSNFIGTIEELDRADRASVETLKRVITESRMSRRPMNTNKTVEVTQNLTFIGTSNKPVQDIIVDATGNRRFVQINIGNFTDKTKKAFWNAITAFDWEALWCAVDERADDPTNSMRDKIKAVQKTEMNLSPQELWYASLVSSNDPILSGNDAQEILLTDVLYRSFRAWEEEFGGKANTSIGNFSKVVAQLVGDGKLPFERKRTNAQRGYRLIR